MRKILLVCLITLLCSTSVWAYDFAVENVDGKTIFYNKLTSSTVEVTYKTQYVATSSYTGDFIVPESVTYDNVDYTVTSIGEWAFDEATITSIIFPNTIKSIGEFAFERCKSMSKLDIPDSVESIARLAFEACSILTSVTIGKSVSYIGDQAFTWCKSLEEFVVSEENEYFCVVDNVLYSKDMKRLVQYPTASTATSFDIPDTVERVEEAAFEFACFDTINIPPSLTSIGQWAFAYCENLHDLTLPNTVLSIEDAVFECSGIAHIVLPEYLTQISEYVLSHCDNLKSVVVPNFVKSIEGAAFIYASLDSLVIGQSVESLGFYPLGWTTVKKIYSLNPEPPATGYEPFLSMNASSCLLYVPKGSKEAYSISDSDTGNPAYEWHVFSTSNIIEVDLTSVVTSDAIVDSSTSAELYCSVSAGDFAIKQIGFEYWDEDGVIHDAISTSGTMVALSSLTPNTTYTYHAYAVDNLSKFYGEEKIFTTGEPEGIDNVVSDNIEEKEYYSIDGKEINAPQKGVNIIRYADGTVKKIYVK